MHVYVFQQPGDLPIRVCAAISTRKLVPKRIERIHQNPVLVVHSLNANCIAMAFGGRFHNSPFAIT